MSSEQISIAQPVLRVRHGTTWAEEHRYIFEVLLGEHLGLRYEAEAVPGLEWVEIHCSGGEAGRLLVGANLLLRPKDQWLTAAVLPDLPLQQLDCQSVFPGGPLGSLPVLFPALGKPKDTCGGNGAMFLPLDVFGGAFFLLTRCEELIIKQRDQHGRFPAEESVGYKAGFLARPLVDEYSQFLGLALTKCFPGLEVRHHESRIRLSHDVDHPYQFFGKSVPHMAYTAGKTLFRHPSLQGAWRLARAGIRSGFASDAASDPFNSYARLMNASEEIGNPGEFYFMAGHRGRRYEEAYDLNRPDLQVLMREIHQRGHVIGLHASYDSFESERTLCWERDFLLSSAKRAGIELSSLGGRQHYLRWENPTTWRSWEKAGLTYDATLGFADQVGFRCGTSREFPVFDAVASRRLLLRERPLPIMDVTMTDYMKLRPGEIIEQLRLVWAAVKRVGGIMDVLIHNCNPKAAWLAQQLCSL